MSTPEVSSTPAPTPTRSNRVQTLMADLGAGRVTHAHAVTVLPGLLQPAVRRKPGDPFVREAEQAEPPYTPESWDDVQDSPHISSDQYAALHRDVTPPRPHWVE